MTPRQSQRANLEADLSRARRASRRLPNGEVQNETTAFGQVGVVSPIQMKLSGQEARRPGGQGEAAPLLITSRDSGVRKGYFFT